MDININISILKLGHRDSEMLNIICQRKWWIWVITKLVQIRSVTSEVPSFHESQGTASVSVTQNHVFFEFLVHSHHPSLLPNVNPLLILPQVILQAKFIQEIC